MRQIPFDNSYARDLTGLYLDWQGDPAPEPRMLLLNLQLAEELGLDAEDLESPEGLAMLTGSEMPDEAHSLAMAYAGHQFGNFSPQLGDGRAMLVGEIIDRNGNRRDLHLKGSGPTPFKRGGDGKAALGPVLREFILGEAFYGLGIPGTRALAATLTGETVMRDRPLPGAVLARIAASHLRVGTFQFFAARGEIEKLQRLTDYAIARHDPDLAAIPERSPRYRAFLDRVIARQADLVARWMAVGFIHGVMNTDNVTISGETIDFGPCAFLEGYDPATVFSSIDKRGRYAYGNQPAILGWDLARLAESLLPAINAENPEAELEAAQKVIEGIPEVYRAAWRRHFGPKFGLSDAQPQDDALIEGFLALMEAERADFTLSFRALIDAVESGNRGLPAGASEWLASWRARLALEGSPAQIRARMTRANPLYIARNHLVEEALTAAEAGDMAPTEALLAVLAAPFEPQEGAERLAAPDPKGSEGYQTFCGT